jgi:sec-independent protein translocase protein TatC
MTLGEHLTEARRRILIILAAVALTTVAAFALYNQILHGLERPYNQLPSHLRHGQPLIIIGVLQGLSLRIKTSVDVGLLAASPVILWQIWRFVTPGLRAKERHYARGFLLATIVFFLIGVGVAYIIFGHALQWLISIGGSSVATFISADSYISLITLMMFVFGFTFEFPVILVGLEFAGLVKSATLLRGWRYAIIIITVIAGVFTPSSDPFSMLAMEIPLVLFYFLAIGVGKLAKK